MYLFKFNIDENMKKKLNYILIALGLATTAQADIKDCWCELIDGGRFYVGATGSPVWHSDHAFSDEFGTSTRDYEVGFGFSANVGYLMPKYCIRPEFELLLRYNKLDKLFLPSTGWSDAQGHTKDFAFMFNLYKDFSIIEDVSIYVGAGLGLSLNEHVVDSIGGVQSGAVVRDELFAWNLMAGMSYLFCERFEATLGYRFFSTQKVETKSGIKSKHYPYIHSLDAGLRVYL